MDKNNKSYFKKFKADLMVIIILTIQHFNCKNYSDQMIDMRH